MDNLFEKLGIYDFIGIWVAGAFTLIYFIGSLFYIFGQQLFSILETLNGIIEIDTFLLLFAFCVLSYLIGSIEHEIGRYVLYPRKKFSIKRAKEVITDTKFDFSKTVNRVFHPFKLIEYNFKSNINEAVWNVTLDEASTELRVQGKSKTVEKFNSIYILSGNIMICFLLHCLAFLTILIVMQIYTTIWIWCIIVFDILMVFLFYIRSYRYFLYWLKNLFNQYYLISPKFKKKVKENESHETAKIDI